MATDTIELLTSDHACTAVQQIRYLYDSKTGADVHFVFEEDGQSERISAHNGKSKKEGDIKIVGYSAAGFGVFLQVIYHKLAAMNMENVGDVIGLAEKYGCDDVLKISRKFLVENVSVDNVCLVWPLYHDFFKDDDELEKLCANITKANWKTIIDTDIFIESKWITFHELIWSVPIYDRIKKGIIERFMEWAKRSCEKKSIVSLPENWRDQIIFCFYNFEFDLMDLGQFIEFEQSYPIFTLDEYKKIIADIYLRLPGSPEAKKRKV